MIIRYRILHDQSIPALAHALEERFGTRFASSESVEATWFDTFDQRLLADGLVLRSERAGGQEIVLRLEEATSGRLVARAAVRKIPSFAHELPAGPLRRRIAARCAPRRLLAWPRVAIDRARLDVQDRRDKRIARIAIDRASTIKGAVLPSFLEVGVLRGFERAARPALELLADRDDLEPSEHGLFEALAVSAGRPLGVDPSSASVSFDAAESAHAAACRVLLAQLGVMDAVRDGVLDDLDVEFLHDWRVAVRRSRSVVSELGVVFAADDRDFLKRTLGELGRRSSPLRDLDVWLETLPDHEAQLPDDLAGSLGPLRDLLVKEQRATQRTFARWLDEPDTIAAIEELRTRLSGRADDGGPNIDELARRRVRKLLARVLEDGHAIRPETPAEALHDLRKRGKRLRYAIEFFGGLVAPALARDAVRALKRLQDVLGDFQDLEIQRTSLRTYGERLEGRAGAASLMAIGVLIEDLGRRQAKARASFGETFATFADAPAVTKLARRLDVSVHRKSKGKGKNR